MITCNRCGRPAPVGMTSCQYCGSPLTKIASSGAGVNMAPRMAASDQQQPELPAWLETLRSGERPGGSPTGAAPSSFSADDLANDGMLPSWMRPERSEMVDNSPSDAHPAQQPASTPAPNTDGTFRGMSASSLIDEQALPSWLREKQAPQAPESISAASLVQANVLPDWMKSMQPQTPAATAPSSLPDAQPAIPPQGIMGNDLIDRQQLPQWMSGQDTSATNNAQNGLAASSLLDVNALPPWLRDANQSQKQSPVPSASAPAPTIPADAPPPAQAPNTNSNLSAASFIDMNALPDWLRPAEDQRQPGRLAPSQPGMAEGQRQTPPARPDSGRVPSRPRGEMVTHEESEVAANVFASMLGVASASPYIPGQQARDAQGRPQTFAPPLQQPQSSSQPLMNKSTAFPDASFPGMPSGYAGMPPTPGYMQAPGGVQGAGGAGTMPGNQQLQQPQRPAPSNGGGMPPAHIMNDGNERAKANAKPAKRGFLSTILDWFQISR